MSDLNKAMLIGRLGRDPEMRFTSNGKAVTNFTMATSEKWTDASGDRQEKTEWHRIVMWGKLAEVAGKYLSKGKQCFVEGRLQTREWEDRDGNKRYTTEIVANQMTLLGGGERQETGQDQVAASDNGPAPGGGYDDFDGIPF